MRHTLAEIFTRMGHQTAKAASGKQALEYIARRPFDLVLLDLKMPGMDGAEVLEAAHPLAPDTVFIFLTAHGTLDSAITGIRHGVFDYLLKPSPVQEIVRVVEAGLAERQRRLHSENPVTLLERALASLKSTVQVQALPPVERFLQAPDITVDIHKRLVVVRGQSVDLTPTEFEILTYLMRHQNRVISCRELVAHLHGYDQSEREARILLRSHIHRLRHKLELDLAQPQFIHTARGRGYFVKATAPDTPLVC
jgi:DNA-binding response OmpR family regulator